MHKKQRKLRFLVILMTTKGWTDKTLYKWSDDKKYRVDNYMKKNLYV